MRPNHPVASPFLYPSPIALLLLAACSVYNSWTLYHLPNTANTTPWFDITLAFITTYAFLWTFNYILGDISR